MIAVFFLNLNKTIQIMTHLVVMTNGVCGMPLNFHYLFNELLSEATKRNKALFLFAPACNVHIQTFHGIDVAAQRLHDAIITQINSMSSKQVTSISFIGHSLGGLINRYVVYLLQHLFDTIQPMFFVTLATPHVGSLEQIRWGEQLFGLFSPTMNQLLFRDHERMPLLLRMSTEPFVSVLNKFHRRIIYANLNGDLTVSVNTASIIDKTMLDPGHSVQSDMSIMYHWTQHEYEKFRQTLPSFAYDNAFANMTMTNLQHVNWERVLIHAPRSLAHIDCIVMFLPFNQPGIPVVKHLINILVT
jgi:hypothetical protein